MSILTELYELEFSIDSLFFKHSDKSNDSEIKISELSRDEHVSRKSASSFLIIGLIFESSISFTIDGSKLGLKGTLAFSGELADDQIQGSVKNNVNELNAFQADRKKMDNQIDTPQG